LAPLVTDTQACSPTEPDPVIGTDGQLNHSLADGTHCAVSVTRAVVAGAAVTLAGLPKIMSTRGAESAL